VESNAILRATDQSRNSPRKRRYFAPDVCAGWDAMDGMSICLPTCRIFARLLAAAFLAAAVCVARAGTDAAHRREV